MTPRADKGEQLAIRLSAELIERIDAYVERLEHDFPGLEPNRTTAIRMLLTRALDDLEGEKRSRK